MPSSTYRLMLQNKERVLMAKERYRLSKLKKDGIALYRGMLGFGDNIYQRAIIREMGGIHLLTSWPQIYSDLPVKCHRPTTRLRTQAKNADRPDLSWYQPQNGERFQPRKMGYDGHGTIISSMLRSVGMQKEALDFSGPSMPRIRDDKYIVIRPATIRSEWRADARNPNPEYLDRAANALRHDYTIVSVADLAQSVEWPVEPLPFAHERYHAGEMNAEQLLSLISGANGLIGGTGWIVPAAIAYRIPLLLIHGGWGVANGPQRIFDPRLDISRIVQAIPDNFCMCNNKLHECDKKISNIDSKISEFVRILN